MGFVQQEFYVMDVTVVKRSNLLNPGEVVDNRWKVVKSIESGAFGSVYYEVQDLTRYPRIFSMKVEAKRSSHDSPSGKFLQIETKVLQKLKSNGATLNLTIEAFGQTDSVSYLVTEFGENIKDVRSGLPKKKFSLRTTLYIAKQTLKAIEELHTADFVHRDIKPRNVVIGRTSRERLSLINFELARKFVYDSGVPLTPRPKVEFCSSILYSSVEALQEYEMGPVDDLWAWFYCVIEMTTGKIPIPDFSVIKERARLMVWMT